MGQEMRRAQQGWLVSVPSRWGTQLEPWMAWGVTQMALLWKEAEVSSRSSDTWAG